MISEDCGDQGQRGGLYPGAASCCIAGLRGSEAVL